MQNVSSKGEECVKEDLDILAMDSREYTDGCCDEIPTDGYQDSMETSIDGCSSLYVGDIEIHIENIVTSTHSFKHRDLAVEGKEPVIEFHFTS